MDIQLEKHFFPYDFLAKFGLMLFDLFPTRVQSLGGGGGGGGLASKFTIKVSLKMGPNINIYTLICSLADLI